MQWVQILRLARQKVREIGVNSRRGVLIDLVPWCAAAAGLLLAVWQFSRRRTAVARAFAIAVATLAVIAIAPSLLPVRPVEPARLDDNPAYRNIRVELSAEPETPAPFWSFQRGQMKVDAKIVGWPSDLIDCQLVSVAATACPTSMFRAMTVPSTGERMIECSRSSLARSSCARARAISATLDRAAPVV